MKRGRFAAMACVAVLLIYAGAQCQSVEELMSQGNGLLSNGAYNEAITVFRKVVSKEPSNFEAQSNLAFAYLSGGRYPNAVTEYKKALGLNPKSALCWENLGFAYEKLGKRNYAIEAIHKSIELDPSNIDARMNMAAFYEDAKMYDKAVSEYEAVIHIDGQHHGEAYSNIARCMLEKGNVAGAKKYLNDAIVTNPANADAHWQLGNIYWKKEGKKEDALNEYKTAVSIESSTPDFYENYALLLEDLNKRDEAIEIWKKAMIYINEALKKEEIQARIDRLEKGEAVSASGIDKKQAREDSDKKAKESLEKLQQDMRGKSSSEVKRIDAPPPDVIGDLDDLNKDQTQDLDLRNAAKKKAAENSTTK
jgi:tetratricopeptide (TPR) repeat protein